MANATWPSSLPQAPQGKGYGEQPAVNVVMTQMDVGPPKRRQRATAALRMFNATYLMSDAQVEVFDDFYENTIAFGALPFDMVNARTGALETYFIKGEPNIVYADAGSWNVSITLERQP